MTNVDNKVHCRYVWGCCICQMHVLDLHPPSRRHGINKQAEDILEKQVMKINHIFKEVRSVTRNDPLCCSSYEMNVLDLNVLRLSMRAKDF